MMREKKSRKGLIYCVTNLKNDKVQSRKLYKGKDIK